jgi:hypothetical protein
MEILASNFKDAFPLFTASLHACDFVSIDTEFSGYQLADEDKPHDFDTLESRYQKLKAVAQKFFSF